MHYIIITLIVIGILIFLGKHILFNPRVNSIITIICIAIFVIVGNPNAIMVFIIPIIDCILDIIRAESYYEDVEVDIDKLYMIKSLTSIPTLGLARAIFLLIVNPLISRSVSSNIKKKMAAGCPLPYRIDNYSNLAAKDYYYGRYINRLEKDGLLVSNIETVKVETNISKRKLANLYPKKIMEKIVDFFAGDKEQKDLRKEAEKTLDDNSTVWHMAYISVDYYEQYQSKISEAILQRKKIFSTHTIKAFEELKSLNLTAPVGKKKISTKWSDYFIIQTLNPFVENGAIIDARCSDEPLNNHQYGLEMISRNANDIPGLALDDDDEDDLNFEFISDSSGGQITITTHEEPLPVLEDASVLELDTLRLELLTTLRFVLDAVSRHELNDK